MMDRQTIISAMKLATFEVLETMFYTPVDTSEVIDRRIPDKHLEETVKVVRIGFTGSLKGEIYLMSPKALSISISSNFLGLDPHDVSDKAIDDTLKEAVNMLAGKTFGIYNSKEVFNLGLPEIVSGNIAAAVDIDSENTVMIGIHTLENSMLYLLKADR